MATPETEGMRYARLAREECIERKGDCAGCINGLETFEGKCMIRWTQREVIDTLGFPTEPPPQAIPEMAAAEDIYVSNCETCGDLIESYFRERIICDECDRIRRNLRGIEKRKEQAEVKARELAALLASFDGIDSRELCARYGVTPRQLRTWQQLVSPVPFRIIGRKAYYCPAEVDAWLRQRQEKESA